MQVRANCLLNESMFPCIGSIYVLGKTEKTVTLRWEMRDMSGKHIAASSRTIFTENSLLSEEEIFSLGLQHIAKYRSGRKKLFSDVEFVK